MPSEVYINIGTPRACYFCKMSKRLIGKLKEYPLLFYSVEEAVVSAEQHYYAAGILLFSQLLKEICGEDEPDVRNSVAHEFYKSPPTKEQYDKVCEDFRTAANKRYISEKTRLGASDNFDDELNDLWNQTFNFKHKTVE